MLLIKKYFGSRSFRICNRGTRWIITLNFKWNILKSSNLKLKSTSGQDYSLKESLGKYVVLYFYPKDDTPGYTIETKDFNKVTVKI